MLKLRYSKTSPYVRKVLILAHEAGLFDRLVLEEGNPWALDTDQPRFNPLGKIPSLVLPDGSTLFDSPVISEYLDSLHDREPFFPKGPARWRALRQQALADGICDAAILWRQEGQRQEAIQSAYWKDRHRRTVERALDVLEHEEAAYLDPPLTIGGIATMAALGYVDLRMGDLNWRETRPTLAAWLADASQRHSFQATEPPR
ncbi:MAG: glutathione S-transferase N-terminal domain-containing protein [Azospirillaceae bacterium]|nr:glutathione S-transferase N-terminal domain-containing protein [Azospirillaceae bacterium]